MLRQILCTMTVLGLSAEIHGALISVPGDVSTIQAAINIASDGDEIVVAPGTYYEAIDLLGKAVTLRSSQGADVTVIDATGLDTSVVTCDSSEGADTVLDGFTITGGVGTLGGMARAGGGIRAFLAGPTIRNCTIQGNSADDGAGLFCIGMLTIENCTFVDNTAGDSGTGGAAMYSQSSVLTLRDCRFINNTSPRGGGAIHALGGTYWLINCEFYGNAGQFAGAVFNSSVTTTMTNCTLSDNVSVLSGGGLRFTSSDGTVSNSIFWNNSPDEINSFMSELVVNNSDIMGGWAGPGSNNMNVDPLFVDPAGGDYSLSESSLCRDEGDDGAVPGDVTTDLAGMPRFVGTVDLGAYEVQGSAADPCPWDCQAVPDGEVGITDFLALLGQWGQPGTSCDFDGHGVDINDFLAMLASWGPCP